MTAHSSAWLVLALAAAGLSGCASNYSALVSEDTVPELAPLKRATLASGNHTIRVATTAPAGDPRRQTPLHVAVHEVRCERPEHLIVMLHGILTDASAWRFVAGDLARDHGLMLIDLPGCGDSDAPDPALLGEGGYSIAAHADRVYQALADRLGAMETQPRITLVAHSLGGAIAIRMLSEPSLRERHAGVLSRIDRVVLLAPLDVANHRQDPLFRSLANISTAKLDLAVATGYLREEIAALQRACSTPDRALREEADKRMANLLDPARRRALQATLHQAVPWRPDLRPDWDRIEAITRNYSRIDRPCLIVWGERDEMLPLAMGYKLAAEIPGSRLVRLPGILHSPHIECPARTVEIIRDFSRRDTP